jgi:RNA polymerase sigma factor (sigma-70 family)
MPNVDKHQLRVLLQRALSGEGNAWDDFFREIRNYLHAEVQKLLGPHAQGPLDHSVIVQSTLRRVWERIGQAFPEGPQDSALRRFFGWIKTIVTNRTWEEWRRERRQLARPTGSAIENVPAPGPGAEDQLSVELAAALNRLPERDRQVVEWFWFDRLSDAEISTRLGCSRGVVRVIRFRALRKLQSPKLQALWEERHDD